MVGKFHYVNLIGLGTTKEIRELFWGCMGGHGGVILLSTDASLALPLCSCSLLRLLATKQGAAIFHHCHVSFIQAIVFLFLLHHQSYSIISRRYPFC